MFEFVCYFSLLCFNISFIIALITEDFSGMVFPCCWILFNFVFFGFIAICFESLRVKEKDKDRN